MCNSLFFFFFFPSFADYRQGLKYFFLAFEGTQDKQVKIAHQVVFPYCVRGTRAQLLICVGCYVHYWVSCAINKGDFLRMHFRRRYTFASL